GRGIMLPAVVGFLVSYLVSQVSSHGRLIEPPSRVAATQECLDKYVLKRGKMSTREPDDVYHETRFFPGTENKVYELRYMLPPDLTCTQCVLQWKYIAGNNWGNCPNGTGAVGCGPQEEFRACADIQITDGKGSSDDTPYPTAKPTRRPTTSRPVTETSDTTTPEEYIDNEIPDEDISKESFSYLGNGVVTMATILLAFVIACLIFLAIYAYYYHFRQPSGKLGGSLCGSLKTLVESLWDRARGVLLTGRKLGKAPLNNNTSEANANAAPVPPPRIKKNTTIGFKGVPDNLI
ncbi:uncharacterized protein LOC103520539, partial [Diaphorina citri]|uniref:Uncharacterized protein LOC103520539 n=1 Tax=Diaphorina citri TaxID=121845 RepID=A0A1S3DL44_DIACI